MTELTAHLRDAPFFGDGQFSGEYRADELVEAYAAASAAAELVTMDAGGVFLFREASWDSRHFGFPVFRVLDWLGPAGQDRNGSLRELGAVLRARGARVAFIRTPAESHPCTHALIGAQALLCACKVMLTRDLLDPPPPTTATRPYREEHRARVLQLASTSFSDNHFGADPHFPAACVSSVYRSWAERLLDDPEAIRLVAGALGRTDGFIGVSVGTPYSAPALPRYGFLDLVTTDPAARSSGIGSALVREAVGILSERGATVFYANTLLTNTAAQRLFTTAGFRPRRALYEWHWWL